MKEHRENPFVAVAGNLAFPCQSTFAFLNKFFVLSHVVMEVLEDQDGGEHCFDHLGSVFLSFGWHRHDIVQFETPVVRVWFLFELPPEVLCVDWHQLENLFAVLKKT